MDRGTWRPTVHWVTKSQTWLKLLSAQVHKYPRGIRASNVDGGVGTRPMESETFKQFPNTNNTK